MERGARAIFLRCLQSLRHGSLVLEDGGETRRFGRLPADVSSGDAPAIVHLRVRSASFYRRVLLGGELGAAESYLRGEWETSDLPGLFRMLSRNTAALSQLGRIADWLCLPARTARRLWTRNTERGSRGNIHAHYDLGNDFFRLFLDDTMTYSSGIFATPQTSLREASVEKYDRICRRLRLTPGQRLVEIGTGWGGFAMHAARNYGCHVTTTTISSEQLAYAREQVEKAGLADRVTLLCEDYRRLHGQFDRLISIEMIEAVGAEYLPTYFRSCESLLRPGGEMVIQAITIPDQRFERYRRSQDFIQKYVFPGGCLPSLGAISAAVERTEDLQLVHLEDFGHNYATTLAHWRARFWERIDDVRQLGLDERFVRLWDYYLAYCEAGFREQLTGVCQLHFRRAGATADA